MEIDFSHGGNIYEIKREYNKEVIDFSANINPLGLPPHVKKVIYKNFNRILHYPDPETKGITRVISEYWKIEEKNVLVGNGSTELIYLIASHFKPRTSIIVVPTFCEYERALRTLKSKIKFYNLKEEQGFNFDISLMTNSDILFLCNPNNPTGNLILKNDDVPSGFPAKTTVIDETFMDFLSDQQNHTFILRAVKNKKIIVLRTLTKFFALPGLRIGYLVAHKEIIDSLKEHQPPWSVNSLAQLAGQMLLDDKNYIKDTHEFIEKERKFLSTQLAKIEWLKIFPSSTNFILIKIKNKKLTSSILVKKLIKNGLLIRDCSNFRGLGDGFIRIAVRTRRENLKFIRSLNSEISFMQKGGDHNERDKL